MTKDDERAARLAQALRDNLRRRKGRARDEAAATPAPPPPGGLPEPPAS